MLKAPALDKVRLWCARYSAKLRHEADLAVQLSRQTALDIRLEMQVADAIAAKDVRKLVYRPSRQDLLVMKTNVSNDYRAVANFAGIGVSQPIPACLAGLSSR
jgi:hypothetical protein